MESDAEAWEMMEEFQRQTKRPRSWLARVWAVIKDWLKVVIIMMSGSTAIAIVEAVIALAIDEAL